MIPYHPANYIALGLIPFILIAIALIAPKDKVPFYAIVSSAWLKYFLIIINVMVYNFFPFDADWSTLNDAAKNWAENSNSIWENLQEARGRTFFSWILSVHYRLVGEALLFVFLINAFLNTCVAIFAYKSALLIFNKKIANYVVCIVAFFPTYIVYSIGPSREPYVAFGFALSTYYFIKWLDNKKGSHLAITFVGLLIALSIHSAFAMIMLALLLLVAIRSSKEFFLKNGKNAPVFIISVVGVLTILPLLLISGWGLGKIGGDLSNLSNVETLESIGAKRDGDSRTGYMPRDQVEVTSMGAFVTQLPKRLLYFSLKPFPWDIRTPADIIGFVLVVFYCLFFISVFKYRKIILNDDRLKYITIAALLLTVIFSLGTANWGSAARHKSKFAPVIILVGSIVVFRRQTLRMDRVVLPRHMYAERRL
ncbi:glucosyltransferase domain-containing protein [Halotalea alkalilenta]|uniref:glucosyltransferase domain-containing protein n=1 Tax=Halotalea alkalilenta TaxID=376489 RepID=UPI0009EED96B|nr:glucosyltransferase domain-containing protein [Halotalea alkalilenta]